MRDGTDDLIGRAIAGDAAALEAFIKAFRDKPESRIFTKRPQHIYAPLHFAVSLPQV